MMHHSSALQLNSGKGGMTSRWPRVLDHLQVTEACQLLSTRLWVELVVDALDVEVRAFGCGGPAF
jgi:hypothetical protein